MAQSQEIPQRLNIKEASKFLQEILNDNTLKIRKRFLRSKHGESHSYFFSLFGSFKVSSLFRLGGVNFENESLIYRDDSVDIVEKLNNFGFVAHHGLPGKMEILVEIDSYCMGDGNINLFDFRKTPYTDLYNIGKAISKRHFYRITNK